MTTANGPIAKQPASRRTGGRAFTLMELLVVISIIALLVTMLMPSLARSKQLARRAVCANNIRQLVLANTNYAEDNDGFYVPAAPDITAPNLKRWHGERDTTADAFDPARGPLKNYLGRTAPAKQCPSFEQFLHKPGSAAAFEAGAGGYGYNDQFIGGRYDVKELHAADATGNKKAATQTARVSEITRPSETVMFTDTAYVQAENTYVEYSFVVPPLWPVFFGPPSYNKPNPSIHFRHLDTAGVAWADGHVDFQEMTWTRDYATHSKITAEQAGQYKVGYFGPQTNELFDLE